MSSLPIKTSIADLISQQQDKYYVVMLSTDFDRDAVAKYIDSNKDIKYWFYTLPYSIFIKTHLTAAHVSNLIETNFGLHPHLVAEITNNYFGRLDAIVWQHLPPQ